MFKINFCPVLRYTDGLLEGEYLKKIAVMFFHEDTYNQGYICNNLLPVLKSQNETNYQSSTVNFKHSKGKVRSLAKTCITVDPSRNFCSPSTGTSSGL